MKKLNVLVLILSVVVFSACKGKPGKEKSEDITVNGVSFEMVKVEHGTFTMGTPESQVDSVSAGALGHEIPTHEVTISKDFYMGRYPVTQKLWKAVMGENSGEQWSGDYGLGDDYPAYFISWTECQTFLAQLNELTGKTFRMPTEAEWEFAARGGNKSKGYVYAGSDDIYSVAWHAGFMGAEKVGGKNPNELNLYDMSGNIYEWCSDYYSSTYYQSTPSVDPQGPERANGWNKYSRSIRGGCWNSQPSGCRVSARGQADGTKRSSIVGLRLVMEQ
ncbi:MAG: formylglycine-generating enzyme family protein [Bacteroidales bacterium]|nr:formylglycine-generating enzyme family protein [Bacteroidales bacterium]